MALSSQLAAGTRKLIAQARRGRFDSPEMQLALIHMTVPRSEITSAMGPAFGELEAVLRAQNVTPTGPWFAHHLHRTGNKQIISSGVNTVQCQG